MAEHCQAVNCAECREERERASQEAAEDRIADGVRAHFEEDGLLLDFYNANPNAVSFGVGAFQQPGGWAWFDRAHTAFPAIDLRDALRKAKRARSAPVVEGTR